MKFTASVLLILATACFGLPTKEVNQPQGSSPVYQQQEYVPHKVYPNADTFPNPGYDFLVPAPYRENVLTSLLPPPTTALQYGVQLILKLLAKVGVVFASGAFLVAVGTFITTLICSLTPICTITFNGFGGVNHDALQAFMTPEKLEVAAALVQDALGKYEEMQKRSVK